MIAWARPLRMGFTSLPLLHSQIVAAPIEALAATLAGLTLILPIVLYYFGDLTLVAPLANMVVAPAVPFAMLFGGIATAAALVSLPAGQFLALLAWPFTSWLLLGTNLLARIPATTLDVPRFPGWAVWAWYGIVAGVVWWHYRRRRSQHASGGERQAKDLGELA